MSDNEGYNGWTNYETWCVDLWIGNEESEYNYWCEQAATVKKEYEKDAQEYILVDTLKEAVEEGAEGAINEASMYSDLLRATIGKVNFGEIAQHMLDAVEVDEEEQKD